MRNFLTPAVASILFLACGGNAPSPASPNAASSSSLELGEITVVDGGQPMLKIHANGSTEMAEHKGKLQIVPGQTASSDSLPLSWTAGPMITADGTLSMNGTPRLRVQPDGTVVDLTNNQPSPVTVHGETATIVVKGSPITVGIGADGVMTVAGGPPHTGSLPRIEGAATPGQRRTVLVVLALLMAPGDVTISAPGVSGPEATAPTPL